jgi:hypothetical protein
MKINLLSGNPLKPVFVAGLILALLGSWGMVLIVLFQGSKGDLPLAAFTRELRAYDLFDAPKRVLEGERDDLIERRLTQLQKQVGGPEEQLSVLKRRRALALLDRRYIPYYETAARKAAEIYSYSAPIAAAAAEALLLNTAQAELRQGPENSLLKNYASRLSQNRFDLLELGLYFFSGDLDKPASAAVLPKLEELLSQENTLLPAQVQNDLLIDDFLFRAYKRDLAAASQKLEMLLQNAPAEIRRMGANYYYDHGNALKAAELYIGLAEEENPTAETELARAADALVLAEALSGARNIWLVLTSEATGGAIRSTSVAAPLLLRSYYNLAAAASEPEEEISWLEKLFVRQSAQGAGELIRIYSVIKYSRLMDSAHSIAIMDDENLRKHPLLDLELLRRRLDSLPQRRAAAETWMLLERHGEAEAIYEWAAWYFDEQKLYDETSRLIKEAERKGISGSWLALHRGMNLIREGKIADGEKVFQESLSRGAEDWRIYASLGRIQESRRNISSALDYYESAAALVKNKSSAAQLQARLSRCLEALDRIEESRRALEYALELDPENINIRREQRRFNSERL